MSDITVRRGNVELTVPEDAKEKYINLGYSVIDPETGVIIEEAPSNDVGFLQNKVAKLLEENEALKAEIAKLKSKKPATKVSSK